MADFDIDIKISLRLSIKPLQQNDKECQRSFNQEARYVVIIGEGVKKLKAKNKTPRPNKDGPFGKL